MGQQETKNGLPVVSVELLESLLREPDKSVVVTQGFTQLLAENQNLFALIQGYASSSKDPEKVYLCAYVMYCAMDKQAFSNKMEKQMQH